MWSAGKRVRKGARRSVVGGALIFGTCVTLALPPSSASPAHHLLRSRVTLPSTQSDSADLSGLKGVPLAVGEEWLSSAIAVRTNAMQRAATLVTGMKDLSRADRTALLAEQASAIAELSALSFRSASDTRASQVIAQATTLSSWQILGVEVPQLRATAFADSLFARVGALSRRESAAAAAIAITVVHSSPAQLASEEALDNAVRSAITTATNSLTSSLHALSGLSPADADTAASVVAQARVANIIVNTDLQTGTTDLRTLVSTLASGN